MGRSLLDGRETHCRGTWIELEGRNGKNGCDGTVYSCIRLSKAR